MCQVFERRCTTFPSERPSSFPKDYFKNVPSLRDFHYRASNLKDVDLDEYKERNEIEVLFGNLKEKVGGYVAAYREDMAMVIALVKFLAWNMYGLIF